MALIVVLAWNTQLDSQRAATPNSIQKSHGRRKASDDTSPEHHRSNRDPKRIRD